MSDGWKWKPRPDICEQIRADIEATSHERIGDRIREAEEAGNVWRAESLRQKAQRQFNLMVGTNGECASRFADVREAFDQYSSLTGYDYKALKEKSLEDQFDITWNPDGSYSIHPKGMKNITPVEMPDNWKPWGRG